MTKRLPYVVHKRAFEETMDDLEQLYLARKIARRQLPYDYQMKDAIRYAIKLRWENVGSVIWC